MRWPRRLEGQLSLVLTALAVGVATLVTVVMLLVLHSAHERSLRFSLQDAGEAAGQAIDSFLKHHRNALIAASSVILLSEDGPARAGRVLGGIHDAHPGFLTMIVTDVHGDIVAASPTHSFSGEPLLGNGFNVADRDYFRAAMASPGVYVSEVFRGRGFGDDIIVAMSHRLTDSAGRVIGVVQASLDLSELGSELGDTPEDPYDYVIIDNRDRAVFASSASTIKPLDSLADRVWLANGFATEAGDVFVMDDSAERWLGVFTPLTLGWTMGVATRVQTLLEYGVDSLLAALILLVAVSLIAWRLARQLARRVSQPVARISEAMTQADLEHPERLPDIPSGAAVEVHALAGSLQSLIHRLADSHAQTREALARESGARELLQQEMDDREQIIKARTLELHEANMALEQLIRQDGLTGLGNRRLLDERLNLFWEETRRSGEWLAIALIDIDHFKSFNDTYGHQAGDQALKKVAAELKRATYRASDLAARYGGEEFCLLLPRTDISGAETFGDRLVQSIRRLKIIHASGEDGLVTISVGVAAMRPQAGGTVRNLIAMADKALYRAKSEGRDRCVPAPVVTGASSGRESQGAADG